MNLLDVLRLLTLRLPASREDDDERLRELEQRVNALGIQQAQQSRVRDDDARLEMLGVSRQVLEERIEAEMQERRRPEMGGDHAGTG